MSHRETSPEIASLAGRILNEEPRKGDEHLSFNALLVQAKKLAASCLSQAEDDDSEQPPRVAITATVDWGKIVNAIIGAFEGGSNYWLREAEYEHVPDPQPSDKPWYAEESFWSNGGKMKLHYDNPEDGEDRASQIVGLLEIKKGLRIMAEKCPIHFADMLSENDDATTHDVFIQCVLFGEIVYG